MIDLENQNFDPTITPKASSGNEGVPGLLVDGVFWYWPQSITEADIKERSVKKKIDKWLRRLVLAFSLFTLLSFILGIVLYFDLQILVLETWLTPNPFFSFLWVSVLSFCFLFYLNIVAKNSGHKMPKTNLAILGEPTYIPSVDAIERRRDIADLLRADAWEVLDEAFDIAKQSGHKYVTIIHLFLGALAVPSTQLMLTRLDLTFDAIKNPLRRKMSAMPLGETEFSTEVKEILAKALKNSLLNERSGISVVEIFIEAYGSSEFLKELLYSVDINEQEIKNVVDWIRIHEKLIARYNTFKKAAGFKPTGNMNRAYTAQQTKFLDSVSADLTREAVRGGLPMLIYRKTEMAQLLRAIEGGGQSVVLVGEAGVGKNTIISGLAELMVEEKVPKLLQDKRLIELSIPHIVSAEGGRGAHERLLYALQEVQMSGNIILVIDSIDQMVSVGGEALDLSSVLAGELEKGYTFVIATTSPREYTASIEGTMLGKQLQRINVLEPDKNSAILVLESKVGIIENKHRVVFTYDAVEALVDLTDRYVHEAFLPEKAILVAKEVALDVSKRGPEWAKVTRADVETIITQKTNIPISKVTAEEGAGLLQLEERIHERMIGQEDAVKAVSSALRRARTELRSNDRPIANFLFLGSTGVGKTELAKTTAEVYFGNEESMLRFDMSEYQDQASIERLIGGVDQAGLLTEAVRKNPFSLLLLDELEKAHPDILNLFLQVMDDGRLTDGTGRTVDFTNIILIATSNAGTQYIQDEVEKGTDTETIKEHLMEVELRGIYRPEFLNRFDGVMVFKPLSEPDVIAITYLMIDKVRAKLEAKGIKFTATDEAIYGLAKKGYDPKFGARPLRRVIQEQVDDAIANFLLTGQVGRRDTLVMDASGVISVEKAEEL